MTESTKEVRSAECGVGSENPLSAIRNQEGPVLTDARVEGLRSYLGLLAETIAHAMGAQQQRPDPALAGLIGRAAELEREASVELLELGIGPATAVSDPHSALRDPRSALGSDVGADVSGVLWIGQTLVIGPLLVERGGNHWMVRLGGKAKAEVLLVAGPFGVFRARTDGRWYPLISPGNTDGGGGAAGLEGRGTGDASAPSAAFSRKDAKAQEGEEKKGGPVYGDFAPLREDVVDRIRTAQAAGFETGFRHAMDVIGRRLDDIDLFYRPMKSKSCRQALDETALALKETRSLVPDVPAVPVPGGEKLPLAVVGQGEARREIREEDV